jgi:hypothetical protein
MEMYTYDLDRGAYDFELFIRHWEPYTYELEMDAYHLRPYIYGIRAALRACPAPRQGARDPGLSRHTSCFSILAMKSASYPDGFVSTVFIFTTGTAANLTGYALFMFFCTVTK